MIGFSRRHRSLALLPPFPVWVVVPLVLQTATAAAATLTLRTVDEFGHPFPARAHIRDLNGWVPDGPDSTLHAHRSWPHVGGYIYSPGEVEIEVAAGWVTVEAGKGFESPPQFWQGNVTTERVVELTFPRYFDMPAAGWYAGDVHIHSHHTPDDYDISPEEILLIAEAEDLPMSWVQDAYRHFTGGIHGVSTSDHLIWYGVEHRNQVYGHACLIGLHEVVSNGCCTTGGAYPMLSDTRESWMPAPDQAMVLAHPCNGGQFMGDGGWPEWGLARGTPVLAASGNLDAYEIVSHSNVDDIKIDDWYHLLNSGFRVPPAAGTDSAVNNYFTRPPGSYRAYVYTGGASLDAEAWTENLRAGRVFVTNYPLITQFTVDGEMAGGTLDLTEATEVVVNFRVRSVLDVDRAEVIVGGEIFSNHALPMTGPVVDREFNVPVSIDGPTWIAVRVEGETDLYHPANDRLFAHTGAVYVNVDGNRMRSPESALHFMAWTDSLDLFVDQRGGWSQSWHADHVHGRIAEARDHFREVFSAPPNGVEMLSPPPGVAVDPLVATPFAWTAATDPVPEDRFVYRLEILRTDSTLAYVAPAGDLLNLEILPQPPLFGDHFWRVVATDLALNESFPAEGLRAIRFESGAADVPEEGWNMAGLRLDASPNPFGESVRLRLVGSGIGQAGTLEIFDVLGRLRRRAELTRGQGEFVWDGLDVWGQPVANGSYWVRLSGTQVGPSAGDGLQIVRMR